MKARVPVLVLLLLAVACAPASEPAPEPDAASEPSATAMDPEAAVDAVREAYIEHYNAGDADQLAALFTDDAVTLFADGGVHMGREDIRAAQAAELESGPTAQIDADATIAGDGVAVQRGTYHVEMTPEGGEMVSAGGYYMTEFEKVGEDWKIGAVIANYGGEPPAGLPAGSWPEEPPAELTDTPVSGLVDAYREHFNAGDAAAVADLYAADAFAAFANMPAAEGRDAVRDALQQRLDAGSGGLVVHLVGTSDMGGGRHVSGGWYEITSGDGAAHRGNWMWLVSSAADGSLHIQWLVTNLAPEPMM